MTKDSFETKYIKRLESLNKPNFEVVEFPEHRLVKLPAIFRHKTCGNLISVTLGNLARTKGTDKGCSYCSGTRTPTFTETKAKLEELDSNYILLDSSMVDHHYNVTLRHITCGNEYTTTWYEFNKVGRRCNICNGGVAKSNETFIKEVNDLVGDEYTLLSNYKNSHKHVEIRHNRCGYEYKVSPTAFLGGKRCPKCSESHGERLVASILDEIGIPYESQKKFPDCVYKNELPFDFYVPSMNTLIEYDGEQHFKPIAIFGGEERFAIRVKRDTIKSDYANEKGFNLIRIPYTLANTEVKDLILSKINA